jgi:predicted AAA+ superfamily ATPase
LAVQAQQEAITIRGARQVGKSTLVNLLAEEQNLVLADINLERYPELAPAFERKDPVRLMNLLEALPHIKPISSGSLLFLDEIRVITESGV